MITIAVLIIILSVIALIVILLHFSAAVYISVNGDGVKIRLKYLGMTLYPREPKQKKSAPKKRKKSPEKPAAKDFEDDLCEDISDHELMQGSPEEKPAEPTEAPTDAHEESKTEKTISKAEEKTSAKIRHSENKAAKKTAEKKNKKEKKQKKSKGGGSRLSELKEKYEKLKPYIPTAWKYFKKLLKSVRIRIDSARVAVGREDAHEAAIYYGAVQAAIANLLSVLSEAFTVSVKRCDVDCVFTENTLSGEAEISVRVRPSAVIAIVFCIAVRFLTIYFKGKNLKEKNLKKTTNSRRRLESDRKEVRI